MSLTDDQQTVADIVVAALDGRGDDLCAHLNQLPRRHVADAAAKSLDLMAHMFRSVITPHDWQALLDEIRASHLLLTLDDPTETP